jgi:hypothetical protein
MNQPLPRCVFSLMLPNGLRFLNDDPCIVNALPPPLSHYSFNTSLQFVKMAAFDHIHQSPLRPISACKGILPSQADDGPDEIRLHGRRPGGERGATTNYKQQRRRFFLCEQSRLDHKRKKKEGKRRRRWFLLASFAAKASIQECKEGRKEGRKAAWDIFSRQSVGDNSGT